MFHFIPLFSSPSCLMSTLHTKGMKLIEFLSQKLWLEVNSIGETFLHFPQIGNTSSPKRGQKRLWVYIHYVYANLSIWVPRLEMIIIITIEMQCKSSRVAKVLTKEAVCTCVCVVNLKPKVANSLATSKLPLSQFSFSFNCTQTVQNSRQKMP